MEHASRSVNECNCDDGYKEENGACKADDAESVITPGKTSSAASGTFGAKVMAQMRPDWAPKATGRPSACNGQGASKTDSEFCYPVDWDSLDSITRGFYEKCIEKNGFIVAAAYNLTGTGPSKILTQNCYMPDFDSKREAEQKSICEAMADRIPIGTKGRDYNTAGVNISIAVDYPHVGDSCRLATKWLK